MQADLLPVAGAVLVAGERGGKLASLVFAGLGVGALWKSLSWTFNIFRQEVGHSFARASQFPNATINVDISPEYMGVGYVIGPRIAGTMFAGNEILLRGGALFKSGTFSRSTQALARWSEPSFAAGASSGAVALCGALLLALGVLDDRPDFSWIDPDYADLVSLA